MGLIFVARACLDPREAPRLWERMAEVSGKGPAQFTSTHPSHATRIKQFEKWMPEAMKVRQERCGAR
jgi:predicted Zn-dependent protease